MRRKEITADFFQWPNHKNWVMWAKRCGIDVNNATVPGWVECDDDRNQVTYLGTRRMPVSLPPDQLLVPVTDDEVIRPAIRVETRHVPITVQLESRALPFPT